MRQFFCFWWVCVQRAFWGNTAFANDWQWIFGYPVIAALLWFLGYFYAEMSGRVEVTLTTGALGVFAAAFLAFLITWLARFIGRFLDAPVQLFHDPRVRAEALARLSGQSVLPLIERGELRGHLADRYRWRADITAASSAHNVTIYLDLQQFRGGIGPITWHERQRVVLGTRDVIAKGETFQVPLVEEFEREDGSKFIGWCLRGYERDPKARLALGTTSTRCRLFLESEAGKKGRFLFYVLDRPAADAPPMLFGEHLLDFEKEWRDLIES